MKTSATRLQSQPKRFLIIAVLTLLTWCVSPLPALGQLQIIPNRGFHTSGSYALSGIETVNTTNGNLILDVPLGALPTGRGGNSGFQLRLRYNSKIWDGDADMAENPNNPNQQIAVTWLGLSQAGGWRYNLRRYSWSLDNRNHHGVTYPPSDLRHWNIWKMNVLFPDGSSREFRPNGHDDEVNDGYFRVQPAPGMTYYSTDGTFVRLDFGATTNDWTLYFPDGTRVVRTGNLQRTYDRNGNYTEISDVANYNGTGHNATVVTDQLGRSIAVEFGTGEDYVHMQGMGQPLTTTIKWTNTYVTKTYRAGNHFQYNVTMTNRPVKVVSEIALPSQLGGNLKYTFGYNGWPATGMGTSVGWGELSSIVLPSGATATYRYKQDNVSGTGIPTTWILENSPIEKKLDYSFEYDGTSSPAPTERWTYDLNSTMGRITGPDNGVTTDWFASTAAAGWNSGLVYKSERPDGSVTERIWQENRPYLPPGETIYFTVGVNTFVKTEFTSIRDSNGTLLKTAIVDYQYDKNGNVTRRAEYDWVAYTDVPRDGTGKPIAIPGTAVLKRVVTNTYNAATPDASDSSTLSLNVYNRTTAPHLLNTVGATEVSDGVTAASRTEFLYDNPTTTGNLTQQKSWDSAKGGYSNPLQASNSNSVSTQYNAYGSPVLTTDALGFQTQFVYGAVGGFPDLYITQIKRAYGSSVQRTEAREYDFNTGVVTRVTDVDNGVSTSTTFDAFGRPTLVKTAEGTLEETRIRIEYADSLQRIITRSDLNLLGDEKLVSIKHFDQLGRIRLSRQLEDATNEDPANEQAGLKVQTRYLFSGTSSYVLTSNPYRAATSSGAGSESTMGWTRAMSDNGGRVIEVQTFGGATCPAPCGSNTTSTGTVTNSYDANSTTVTDQAGKKRRSMVDALGLVRRVDEPDASGSLGSTASPVQPTGYDYDLFGNLTTVTQGSQVRTFTYDSLSRLRTALNPESATVTYQYDDNGNLVLKTDARGVSIHYSYDALSRNTRRWYNGSNSPSSTVHNQPALPSGVGQTDEAKFFYDTQSLAGAPSGYDRGVAKGRLVAQTYGAGTNGDYFSYDNLGRVTRKYQQLGTANYKVEASYNRAGAITQLKYPSDRTVNYTYDSAGRLNVLYGNLGGTSRTYSTGIIYSPSGGMTKEQFGTNTAIYNKLFYNSRGQLAEIRASTSYTGPTDHSADRGAIVNNYSTTDNNGNLRKQEIHIPSQTMRYQEYVYDSLNRLEQVREVIDGETEQWKQKFVYDRWGNRRIDTSSTYGIGINNKALDVVPTNNRLAVPTGQTGVMQYDAVGNLTNDTYTGAGNRTYDGENKITSAWGGNNQAQLYGYDASGQRIKRTVDGVETWQVYGIGGELLAEYPVNGTTASPQKEYCYRNGQLLITAESESSRMNLALATNGATATASSQYSGNYPASSTINGDRRGLNWNNGGGWNDATVSTHPDWLQIDFNGSKTIDEINVFTLQDNPATPAEPTESMMFTLYGLTGYSVQYWNSSAWVTVTGGTVTGNNKVWKKFTFSPITTTKIRVLTSSSPDAYSRLTEVEAWGTAAPPPRTNFALGGITSASSTISANYPSVSTVNGDRRGLNWNNGGGWNDATVNTHPDWLQIDFSGSKTIDEINVFTLQDNPATPAEPTESMTFTLYGLTGYSVQYWNSSAWITVPGGTVTGNNKVWKKFTFTAITTTKIRVLTSSSPDAYSRLTEVEVWGPAETGASGGVKWLVADPLGTPRMIFDHTGDLANMKRHDYLPFGEEVFAPTGGRTTAMGYSGGDGVRQQFTQKERDIETGLDFFGARYYAGAQGRFTGADPYDINLERQNTTDPEESDALFREYIFQPHHWNRYAYALNNPLRYVDPDGLREYDKVNLLGKMITIKISDDLRSADGKKLKGKDLAAAQDKIKSNIDAAIAKINSGATKLTSEQKTAINSMNGIEVRTDIRDPGMNTSSRVFYLTPSYGRSEDVEMLASVVVHDSFHADQDRRGVKSRGIEAEKEASVFTLGVLDKLGITDARIIRTYQIDAKEGHVPRGEKTRPPRIKTP